MDKYKLRIKEFRANKNLTQKQLADKVGISRSFLSELENGKYDISLNLLIKIGEVLEVDIWVLVDIKLAITYKYLIILFIASISTNKLIFFLMSEFLYI